MQFDKSSVSDMAEKRIALYKTEKEQLPFKNFIFPNGQPLHRFFFMDDFNLAAT